MKERIFCLTLGWIGVLSGIVIDLMCDTRTQQETRYGLLAATAMFGGYLTGWMFISIYNEITGAKNGKTES